MAQVPNSALYAYQDGLVVTAAQLNQDIQVLQTALNDNYYRLLRTVNVNGTAYQVQGTAGVANVLNITSDTTIKITSSADTNGNINLALSVASAAITSSQIAAGAVGQTQLANDAVGTAQIQSGAVTQDQMASNSVGTSQIQAGAVTQTQMAPNSVGSAQVIAKSVPASNISETRMGDTQSALNDLNSRLASAITSGSVSEVGDAHNSIPLSTSYATLKARLDSMDLAGIALAQKAINSGVIDYVGNISGAMSSTAQGQPYVNSAYINEFAMGKFQAFLDGALLQIQNWNLNPGNGAGNLTGQSTVNVGIVLDAPPVSNVSPSLAGSARDDLVFLEAWRDATTSEWAWRIRVVDGVDFGTYAQDGFTSTIQPTSVSNVNTSIQAQGGNTSPISGTAVLYAFVPYNSTSNQYFSRSFPSTANDTGLYVAGSGSSTAQTTLNTYDGYSYAVPLFRVRRRNSTAFDPDTNPMGGQLYLSNTATYVLSSLISTGQSATFTPNATDLATYKVGQTLNAGTGNSLQITAINGGVVTVLNVGANPITNLNNGLWHIGSDRPDGFYSNIIDASDIVDLRHQVSPTGFNYQALLEKNLDLLLRGQLVTNQTQRYSRDYIGLNTSSYTDDANTVLYLKFDGSMAGTANGAAVNGTVSSGTASYSNGVEGNGVAGANAYWNVTIPSGSYTIEGLIKFPSVPNAYILQGFQTTGGSGATSFVIRLSSQGYLGCYVYDSGNNIIGNLSFSATIPTGTWHYVKLTINTSNSTVSLQTDEQTISGSLTGTATPVATQSVAISNGTPVWDLIRVSNIVRTSTPLPSNFSYANGDRILDGPNGDFSFWSDDVGGTVGTGGRTNPYGLTHVPNVNANNNGVAGRISYNGSEIRHYYGQGVTEGWNGWNTGTTPTGGSDNSSEYQYVNSNETADGTKTTFTFNLPASGSGFNLLNGGNYSNTFKVGSSFTTPSSVNLNASTGQYTVVFSTAPASGASVQALFVTGARHAHFVPSTKGFIIHDWTDETHTGDGTTTVFTTAKYKVTSVNHVRVNGVIQNGGYTVTNLNSASGGTTITFTTAPANGATIDIVYESVITPALGDTVRVLYQHVPYQGLLGTSFAGSGKYQFTYVPTNGGFILTLGTGSNSTPSVPAWMKDYPAPSAQLPIANNDYALKHDVITLANMTVTGVSSQFLNNEQVYEINSAYVGNIYSPLTVSTPSSATIRGYATASINDGGNRSFAVSLRDLSSSIPHLCCLALIAQDTTSGEILLYVATTVRSDARNFIQADGTANYAALDVFKIQGRPIVKSYGGVSA